MSRPSSTIRAGIKTSRSSTLYRTFATPSADIPEASSSTSTATSSTASSSSKTAPSSTPLKAALLLSRQPLLRKTPHPLRAAYNQHSLALRDAIANPVPEDFYFSKGSLSHRRYQKASYERSFEVFGPDLAGKPPPVGDIPAERPLEPVERDHWEKADSPRGEKSLERQPEEELFCLVQDKKGKKWAFPDVTLEASETLHDAVDRALLGVDGAFDGKTMDSWLVTKKPIGVITNGDDKTFYLRSHILAGEPKLSKGSIWSSWAWFTSAEVESRLKEQGDEHLWEGVKGMFGVPRGSILNESDTPLTTEKTA